MKNLLSSFRLALFAIFATILLSTAALPAQVQAQVRTQQLEPTQPRENATEATTAAAQDSTAAAEATSAASLATPAAKVTEQLEAKQEQDITQPTPEQKSRLAAFLDENPPGPLSWYNFLQYGIRDAVQNGLPANIIVLLLLFPVITSVIAFSRHIIGLKGFGIYIPAVLSVAFVSTGIATGVITFAAVLLAAMAMRLIIRHFKLPYLPRTAMLLWGVSLIVLVLLILAANFGAVPLISVSIFPLLIIMLLTENFMESQLFSSSSASLRLLLETLFIALFCSLIIGLDSLQRFVLVNPEATIIAVALFNYAIGNYTGLRLMEYVRFKEIIGQQ